MERLDEILFSIGKKRRESIKLDPNFYEKTILAIRKKKREFFSISALVFAVFIALMYISGIFLASTSNNKIYNYLSLYISLVISFFTTAFTLFWLISNERFVAKFLNKIFKKNIVETFINQQGNCFFSYPKEGKKSK